MGARLVAARLLPQATLFHVDHYHTIPSPSQIYGNWPLKMSLSPKENTRLPSFVTSFGPARPALSPPSLAHLLSLSTGGESSHVPPP